MNRIPFCAVALLACGWLGASAGVAVADVRGSVRDGEGGPVSGAVVRVQGGGPSTSTDQDGAFVLSVDAKLAELHVTAWAPGRYIARSEAVRDGDSGVELVLERHPTTDDAAYRWLLADDPATDAGGGCAHCHRRAHGAFDLPVDEWRRDAHGTSGLNERFLSLYLGTDLDGHSSPPTRYRQDREYGPTPIRPDPGAPAFGPGYRLDFPETAGNCAACHTPMAAVDGPYSTDPSTAGRLAEEGVGCDFCHKIWSVRLDPRTGLPYPNTPGVLSIELRRPEPGRQLFLGPLDDVAPGEDAFSPLQRSSALCAPCHFGTFWSTVVYGSYAEWLDSPYSDPENGRSCQDCHMPALGAGHFARPEVGGLDRNPETIHSHRMPGAADAELLRSAVDLTVSSTLGGGELHVEVAITNVGAGHCVPTDSPLRHLILVVRATDPSGGPLELTAGGRVPEWGGAEAGLPGAIFARVLEDLATHVAPTAAYWNPTRVESDTRIPPLATSTSRFDFALSDAATLTAVDVDVLLLYRRAFQDLVELKGWEADDIVMAHHVETLTPERPGGEP